MSNYVKATNFTAKDSLPSGNSGKIIKGTEIDVEFTAIASAISSKADSNSPTLTGTPLAPTASSGTNNTQIATTAFVAAAVTASFPSGGIILWSGSVASIPSGWYLCDGNNSTPDLRDKFVVGAGSTYAVGATGGSPDAVLLNHTHTGTTGAAGSHTHGAWSNTAALSASSYTWGSTGSFSVGATNAVSSAYTDTLTQAGVQALSTAPDHTHTFTTANAGTTNGAGANLPPYYALCYIMKA